MGDVEVGRLVSFSTGVRDPKERRRRAVCENDHAFPAPRPAAPGHDVAEPLRSPAGYIHPFQARRREKPEGSTVGRPEGMKSVFGAGKRHGSEAVKGAYPQQWTPTRGIGDECDGSSVG